MSRLDITTGFHLKISYNNIQARYYYRNPRCYYRILLKGIYNNIQECKIMSRVSQLPCNLINYIQPFSLPKKNLIGKKNLLSAKKNFHQQKKNYLLAKKIFLSAKKILHWQKKLPLQQKLPLKGKLGIPGIQMPCPKNLRYYHNKSSIKNHRLKIID